MIDPSAVSASSSASEEFAELSHFELDPSVVKLLGYEYCIRNQVVVLGPVKDDQEVPVVVGNATEPSPKSG